MRLRDRSAQCFFASYCQKTLISHISGICNAENIASRRVLEKCGFIMKFEGAGVLHGKQQFVCRYERALCTVSSDSLIENIDKIHNTPMGAERVIRNIHLQTDNAVTWCKEAINQQI